ncbi:hypothetical protein ISN44_As05g041160 [Arabidopsis suecica]|uniref:Disease resistance R13L4/SHOC-2-like LRR domain-containing protein n=1 Tax=Arabidopsis suecica TaxID=45249 RepID=A0A8T2DKV9_ARASU|nr:hypothetical protein ISN44_As05g041160 [Arabidopsis suecica]
MQSGNWDTDVSCKIHAIIKTFNHLYRVIQLKDAYQDIDEGIVVDEISEVGLEIAKSAPPRIYLYPVSQIFMIMNDLSQLKSNLKHVKRLQSNVTYKLDKQLHSLLEVVKDEDSPGTLDMRLIEKKFYDITKTLLKLNHLTEKVSVMPKRWEKKKASRGYNQYGYGIVCLPGIHANEDNLKRLAVFRDVKREFEGLRDDEQRICLLSFAVFPVNQEVNRTMLMYWWIGEGILPVRGADDAMRNILGEFTEKKLIEPVANKRKVEPSSYKMTPFVHASVVLISNEIGVFDIYHQGRQPAMKKSLLKKVCLVEMSSGQPEAIGRRMAPADIETVFNVSERLPDFIFKWFSSMKRLKVLYLGRWERNEREVEVDSHGLMKDLSLMTKLRFLSFQGITTIISITALKLHELIVLDLRGCYNLEELPDDIDGLRSLVHLDLTGCDALVNIPLRLSFLDNLEVIKGFVVADEREIACKLSHLKYLKKLKKLSVIVYRKDFSLDDLRTAIEEISALENLKVRWRSYEPKKTTKTLGGDNEPRLLVRTVTRLFASNQLKEKVSLPINLRKLELRRFPDSKLPDWLQPQNLIYLKKLHLGSSRHLKKFSDSLPEMQSKCTIEVLRLKYLQKLKVDWIELKELYFPNLHFLEIYDCPRVTFCPCDGEGIWRRNICVDL